MISLETLRNCCGRHLDLARAPVPPGVQVQQPQQCPQARVTPRVRRGSHQDQPVAAPRHRLRGLVPFALLADVTLAIDREREPVRLVDYRQVPLLLGSLERLQGPGRCAGSPG